MTDSPRSRKVPSQTPLSLVSAGTVVTSDPSGAFEEGTFHGVYRGDLRRLARYQLTVDGVAPNVLRAGRRGAATLDTAMATSFNQYGDARGVLLRHREVNGTVVDRYTLHRLVAGPPMRVAIALGTDLADLLSIKASQTLHDVRPLRAVGERRFIGRFPGTDAALEDDRAESDPEGFDAQPEVVAVEVHIDGPAPRVVGEQLVWDADPAVGADWTLTLTIIPGAASPPDGPGATLETPARLEVDGTDHRWGRAVAGAVADLSALRIEADGQRYLAAGAPWFIALFGRDALLTSFSSLALGTDSVLDTLEVLARWQGTRNDARSLEEPGRILHELRTGASGVFGLQPGEPYYGTADATPLFVFLLAEVSRWGGDPERVRALLPAARAAVTWCLEYGDTDGDGFVEAVADPSGIENQGWKDSGDSMVHADGSPALPPIALAEVQAYVYGALVGLAELEEQLGVPASAGPLRLRAGALRERYVDAFWSEELGGLVLGLDADKRPLSVAASNMGHALWTGILDHEHAELVAQRVTAPDLFSSWGIRTLGAEERAYSPLAYHRGAIWPHDTAIIAHGLARVGARSSLQRVTEELLELTERFDYRLPELLGGTDRSSLPAPVPYPVACSPQAWSAAAPLLLLRALLGLEPDVPAGVIRLSPALAEGQQLSVTGLRIGSGEISITVGPEGVMVDGADGLRVELAGGL